MFLRWAVKVKTSDWEKGRLLIKCTEFGLITSARVSTNSNSMIHVLTFLISLLGTLAHTEHGSTSRF